MTYLHAIVLTIFPEMFPGPLQYSLSGQALAKEIWSYQTVNIRDFGLTKHKKVDDEAYGGGSGLIMRADVLGKAIEGALKNNPATKIYYPSPRGRLLNQEMVRQIIKDDRIIILCGRFEGIDERVISEYNLIEVSVGDYILAGGEIAAMVILDSCIRLLPGVLANQSSLDSESLEKEGEFSGLLECPLYTRPAKWKGMEVPATLLSGNHQQIKKWRLEQSRLITSERRPELLVKNLNLGKNN